MSDSPYLIWSIWGPLPILLKLFFLILVPISLYTLISAGLILVRLRALVKRQKVGEIAPVHRSLVALRVRSSNLRQLICATFFLFGFVLFLALPLAFIVLGDSKTPTFTYVVENFSIFFAFASNVFFVFLVLHCVQWFVSGRVHACALRLSAQSIA
jgi:hypothetical protein